MGDKGQYSKSRRSITSPVVKVPDNTVAAPKLDEATRGDVEKVTVETVKKLDKDRFVLRKTTGWLIAALVLAVLGGGVYLASNFATRAHQVDHLQDEIRDLNRDLDKAHKRQLLLERRIVELETQHELMQEWP